MGKRVLIKLTINQDWYDEIRESGTSKEHISNFLHNHLDESLEFSEQMYVDPTISNCLGIDDVDITDSQARATDASGILKPSSKGKQNARIKATYKSLV